jgi:hypothetical protein
MHTETIVGLLVLLGIAAFVAYTLYSRSKSKNNTDPSAKDWSKVPEGAVETSRNFRQLTQLGAVVYSKSGVTADALAKVDAGLTAVFEDARASGYSNALDYKFFEIFIPALDCVLSPEQKIPSFLIRSDAYDGTIYDYYNPKGSGVKDGIGVIYAAEMVQSLGTQGSTYEIGQMICCNSDILAEAVRNGAEHIIIANNDSEYFSKTWFHDVYSHPLLPKREEARGLMSGMSAAAATKKYPGFIALPTH